MRLRGIANDVVDAAMRSGKYPDRDSAEMDMISVVLLNLRLAGFAVNTGFSSTVRKFAQDDGKMGKIFRGASLNMFNGRTRKRDGD